VTVNANDWHTEELSWPRRARATSTRSSPCSIRLVFCIDRAGGLAVLGFTVAEGRILEIDLIADPEKLRTLAEPG
jgi:hypothetical protein